MAEKCHAYLYNKNNKFCFFKPLEINEEFKNIYQ